MAGGGHAAIATASRRRAQFHGRSSASRDRGRSAMRASTSASQACGSTSLSLAVVIRRVHEGGPLAAAIGAGEEPGLAAEGDAAQGALGGVVGEADAAVVEEAGEAVPALEHVVHRLGDGGVARELARSRAHPALELGDQRSDLGLPDGEAGAGVEAVDRPLDRRRSRRCASPPRSASGEIGGACLPRRALAAMSASSKNLRRACAQHSASVTGPRRAIASVELAEAGIGVGLEDAAPAGEMRFGMLATAVAGVAEERGRRCAAGEGAVVADIDPEPAGVGLALGQHRHRGVVAVQPLGRQHMGGDQRRAAARARRCRRRPGRPASRG